MATLHRAADHASATEAAACLTCQADGREGAVLIEAELWPARYPYAAVAPLRCAHPFNAEHPNVPAHPRGHCAAECGYALLGSSFEPLGAFCSLRCQAAWQGQQSAPCAACGSVHAGPCLEGAG